VTVPGIPAHLYARAAALPENRHAREALERLAGGASPVPSPEPSSAPQRGTEHVRKPRAQVVERDGPTAQKRVRRGQPNSLELRFASEVLDPLVYRGELVRYEFEGLSFHVHAAHSRCTPDYIGWDRDGKPYPFEVKGRIVHAASVLRMKLHAAARPWLRWRIYARKDGAWRVTFDNGD